jgi:hypothetical protein
MAQLAGQRASANRHAVVSIVQRVSSASVLCNTFGCHTPGVRFNNMDMLTIGKGGMLEGQYRAEVFLCVVKSVVPFTCCARYCHMEACARI